MSGCIHCEAMRDEVAELRAALGLSGRISDRMRIGRRFGLQPAQAKLVQALYDAAGRVVPRATLDSIVLSEDGALNGADTLKTHVCRARSLLGKDTIDTWEGGYSMTPAGRALVYTALKVAD